jgi:hypothetical protein
VAFGRDLSLRCPYWVGGAESCGIWRDRNATCRTWFCRTEDGASGRSLWGTLREALDAVDRYLADQCLLRVRAPHRGADAAVWAAFFVACADHVDALPADLPPPRGIESLREAIAAADARRSEPVPERPIPAVVDQDADDEHMLLYGKNRYDPFPAPPGVMELFVRLDGKTPWREALAAAEAVAGPLGGEALVRGLWRAGLLSE